MVGHGGSSAGSYLTDPTSPIPSHWASITLFKSPSASTVVTSTVRGIAYMLSMRTFAGAVFSIVACAVSVKCPHKSFLRSWYTLNTIRKH